MTEALQQEIRTLKNIFESERDPEGRVFAPLADAFRRAGEVQQAVRLLSDGLARHPHFVPGHVVAAQLYVEQGLAEEAGIAARQALGLDAENVNALRSLLRVLEEKGDAEAEDVRARLMTLEPDFASDFGDAPRTARRPSIESVPVAPVASWVGDEDGVDADAETVELTALRVEEPPSDDEAAAGVGLTDLDWVPEAAEDGPDAYDELVIDLDALVPLDSQDEFEEPAGLADLAVLPDLESAAEEPIIDLDSLAPVSAGDESDDVMALVDPAAATTPDLPVEEPVIDLDDLASVVTDADAVVSLTDLTPEPAEDVMDLSDLAPEPAEDVMDLSDLAPEPAEDVMDLSDLAPEPAEDVMDLSDLAPEPAEDVMDLSDLAPEPAEDVMDLSDLAPEPAEDVMDLSDLAPEPAEDVMDLSDLAPESAKPPEPAEEVMDLSDLAPDPEPEDEEPVLELSDLAPLPRVDESTDVVIDLDALRPTRSALSDDQPQEDAAEAAMPPAEEPQQQKVDAAPEDEGPGEPVYTRTLGELYVKQGATDKAIDVFRHLSKVSPGDPSIARRLEVLESGVTLGGEADSEQDEEEVETLARELAEGGRDAHDVESPFAWADEGEGSVGDAEPGPTINDYFSGLLTWKPGAKP